MNRLKYVSSAAFFVGYLVFQAFYPALKWFDPWRNGFSWSMYSGASPRPRATVVFEDGSTQTVPDPLYARSGARVLGASVDLWRFMPPYLCAHVKGAREVRISHASGRSTVTTCRPPQAD
jgi:hypothetical protein